ncbi:hypothetical protein Tco_1174293 [Tanacetum coccineum]
MQQKEFYWKEKDRKEQQQESSKKQRIEEDKESDEVDEASKDDEQKEEGIFISQDKYVAEILKKFNHTDVKSASTPVDLEKPLVKDGDADDVDVHLYRSMIRSLMYLTASRPDIMFACKKQTVVATSTTKAEYVAAASCYGQVGDEVIHKELGESMERVATAASSLEAE